MAHSKLVVVSSSFVYVCLCCVVHFLEKTGERRRRSPSTEDTYDTLAPPARKSDQNDLRARSSLLNSATSQPIYPNFFLSTRIPRESQHSPSPSPKKNGIGSGARSHPHVETRISLQEGFLACSSLFRGMPKIWATF